VWNRLAATPEAFYKWARSHNFNMFYVALTPPPPISEHEKAIFSFEAFKLPRYAFKVRVDESVSGGSGTKNRGNLCDSPAVFTISYCSEKAPPWQKF
jgi:hypothetical protein